MKLNLYFLCETSSKGVIKNILEASASIDKTGGKILSQKAKGMQFRNGSSAQIVRMECETAHDVIDADKMHDTVQGFYGGDIIEEMSRFGMNTENGIPDSIAEMCRITGGQEHAKLYEKVIAEGIDTAAKGSERLRKKKKKERAGRLHVFPMYSVTKQKSIRQILGAMASFDERIGSAIEIEKNHRVNTEGNAWQTVAGEHLIETAHFECDVPDNIVSSDDYITVSGFSRKDISDMLVALGYSGDNRNVSIVLRCMERKKTESFLKCQRESINIIRAVMYVQTSTPSKAEEMTA